MSFFLEWPPNCWADHAEILHSLWDILCTTFGKKWPDQVRSLSYDAISATACDHFFKEIIFSAMGLAAIEWNGDIVHDLGQHTTKCDLWYCKMTFQRSSQVTDLDWPHTYQQWLIWLFFGFPGVLRPSTWLIFLHGHVYSASLHYPMPIKDSEPSLPSGDFADVGDAVPFRDTVRYKHSIKNL